MAGLDAQESSFAHHLSYGAVRLRGRLDHLLALRVHGGLDRLDAPVLDILRLGLFQLLYQDVPDYAAVSQSVELARSAGQGRAAGLVNGVLRAAARQGADPGLFPDRDADPAGWISTWGSHPRWLVERWLGRWPVEAVARLVELNNTVPELYLVPLDGDVEGAAEALRRAGRAPDGQDGAGDAATAVTAEALSVPGVVRVSGLSPAEALARVPGFVQDPAAALVCRYATPLPAVSGAAGPAAHAAHAGRGAPPPSAASPPVRLPRIADLCAAPGGKAMNLARHGGLVMAADPSERRLVRLRENVTRLSDALPIAVVRARAEDPPVRNCDLVLVDVPCTGTGTLRRHPDARWRLQPGDPAELARVQGRILRGASRVVPPGALLVYSTCTLEPEENREVVEAFLRESSGFRLEPPEDGALAPFLGADGCLEVQPQATGFDGAFAARLRRVADA